MRITRLHVRNFRVYEHDLDLELPPGLVGIYGVNGSGKSTLLDAIRWALWGQARTPKDEIRTSGVNADCLAELEFEHEGHLYLVRRTITGQNATVKAQAHADGLQVAEGVTDTRRFVQSILGMDDAAFRASVFAEQKQLSAFSNQRPGERRDLVLKLLGITPLDTARDNARRDAKQRRDEHDRLRELLPDIDALRAAAGEAEQVARASDQAAVAREQAAGEATRQAAEAEDAHRKLGDLRREYDALVAEGKTAAAQRDNASKQVATFERDQSALERAAGELARLQPDADGVEELARDLRRLDAVLEARRALAALPVQEPPAPPADDEAEAARAAAETAGAALAALDAELRAAQAEQQRVADGAGRAADLSGEAECPLCGQALGDAFEAVQRHRAEELDEVTRRVEELARRQKEAATHAQASRVAADRAATAVKRARDAWTVYEQAAARRTALEETLASAVAALGRPLDDDPERAQAPLAAELDRRREAASQVQRLRGRLERRAEVEAGLERARAELGEWTGRVETLREKVAALGFRKGDLDAAQVALDEARRDAAAAVALAQAARLAATEARARGEAAAARVVEAGEQHARLADLGEESRHLNRMAELLGAFRNAVVASVGPRLAAQAAELFAALTDHEYDRLEVDPETYGIRIFDAGRAFDLDRFSGSEIDLANLALRVAISEHVRFQSGGAVGLLVLDEVFGPLDDDRKERMLLALERLRGRFRQVLVVTHDAAIKEQLPNAIEVVKLAGRRATARQLLG